MFGSNQNILGETVHVNGYPFTVVGIAPEMFRGMSVLLATDVWVPLHMAERASPITPQFDGRIDPWLFLIGRLRPGLTLERARADLELLAANLKDEYPENQGKGVTVIEASHNRFGFGPMDQVRGAATVLMGVVGIVLMIAAFNVANIHLARALARQREMALRVSLGASRFRVVRQLLTESVLLSLVAGGAGLMLAMWAQELIVLQPIAGFPLDIDLGIDSRVLGFTLLLSIITGVFFGMAPAIQTIRSDQASALRSQSTGVSIRKTTSRLQTGLVIGQIALSLTLLVSAGLLLKSWDRTREVDPGFGLRNGLVVTVNLGFSQYAEVEGRRFQAQIQDRIAAMPGVESVAAMAFVPFSGQQGHHDAEIEGYVPEPGESMLFPRNMVGPNYLETMGIPIIEGRGFDERDRDGSKPVALVNETMAQKYWPGGKAVGGRVEADLGVEREVIGIVQDFKYGARAEEPKSYLFIPLDQAEYLEHLSFVARTAGDPSGLIASVQREVTRLDPNLPTADVVTVGKLLDQSLLAAKGTALFISVFGVLAVALGMVGVYGVMSYLVSQRWHEYGVRMALGAENSEILSLVMRRGLMTAALGTTTGLVLAAVATRALAGLLFEVSPLDPGVFVLVSLVIVATTLLAGLLPARAATRVNPIDVLRAE
jgi:predicted permease